MEAMEGEASGAARADLDTLSPLNLWLPGHMWLFLQSSCPTLMPLTPMPPAPRTLL